MAAIDNTIRVIDFETTGMEDDDGIIEAGWCDLSFDDSGNVAISPATQMMVNPNIPIKTAAMAVHHISDDDIKGAPPPDVACRRLMDGADIFCAHNAKFERQFFRGGDKPWICTYRCALNMWPELESHSNQFLRYHLGLGLNDGRAMPPHRAAPDAYVTAHILRFMLESGCRLEELLRWTDSPVVLHKVRFGKHQGKLWSEVPDDYLRWILSQDFDEDVKHTARTYLGMVKEAAS